MRDAGDRGTNDASEPERAAAERSAEGADARPLAGRSILVTRPEEGTSRMGRMLADLGARVLLAPLIAIREPDDWASLDAAVRSPQGYDWLIFTSANGPKYLARRLRALGADPAEGGAPALAGASLLAVGPATGAAVRRCLRRAPDRIAEKYVAEGVIALLEGEEMAGKRVLLPRAKQGRDAIPEALRKMGAVVDDVAVYQTVPAGREALRGVREELEAGKIDMLTFTSSSALKSFVGAAGADAARGWARRAKVASIGPMTTQTARAFGIAPDVEAAESTIPGMARAVASFYEKSRGADDARRRGRKTA